MDTEAGDRVVTTVLRHFLSGSCVVCVPRAIWFRREKAVDLRRHSSFLYLIPQNTSSNQEVASSLKLFGPLRLFPVREIRSTRALHLSTMMEPNNRCHIPRRCKTTTPSLRSVRICLYRSIGRRAHNPGESRRHHGALAPARG